MSHGTLDSCTNLYPRDLDEKEEIEMRIKSDDDVLVLIPSRKRREEKCVS